MGNADESRSVFDEISSFVHTKVRVSIPLLMEWKALLLAEQRAKNVELWDKGVIQSPNKIYKSDVISWCIDNNVDVYNSLGLMNLSGRFLDLCLRRDRGKLNGFQRHCLGLLSSSLTLQERMKRMDIAYSSSPLSAGNRYKTLSVGVAHFNGLLIPKGASVLDIDLVNAVNNEYVWKEKSFNSVFRKTILREAGIDADRFAEGGFFISGLSATDEVELLDVILLSGVELDGEIADSDIVTEIKRHKDIRKALQIKGVNTLLEENRKFLERNLAGRTEEFGTTVFLTPTGILYARKKTRLPLIFSLYAVDATTEDLIPGLMQPKDGVGLTGEFIELDEYYGVLNKIKSRFPELTKIGGKHLAFPPDVVVENPIPIEVGSERNKKLYVDVFQTGVYKFFTEQFGNTIQASFGEEVHSNVGMEKDAVLRMLKSLENRFETSGKAYNSLRSSVVGGPLGLRKALKCLQK